MKRFMMILAGAAVSISGSAALAAGTTMSGEYVEARTCSVYTGACHANGEAVTVGREALMVWHVNKGAVDGVNVNGLTVVAVLTGKDNLAQKDCLRTSVVYVDSKATDEQRGALIDVLQEKYGCSLGRITAVKPSEIQYAKNGLEYTVRVPGTAYLKTTRYACDHCVMPHQVWYQPLVPLKSSLVAKASVNQYKGSKELNTTWMRTDENSSYVGEFAF